MLVEAVGAERTRSAALVEVSTWFTPREQNEETVMVIILNKGEIFRSLKNIYFFKATGHKTLKALRLSVSSGRQSPRSHAQSTF